MLKKLFQGFIFGVGFTIGIITVIGVVGVVSSKFTFTPIDSTDAEEASYQDQTKWRKLTLSEKIPEISGMALVRFKDGEDSHKEAYVEKILTKENAIKIPLEVGDRVEKEDYYPSVGSSSRNGVLLLFTGNPPRKIEGAYMYEDRLIGHGDMPLEIFLKKFKEESIH